MKKNYLFSLIFIFISQIFWSQCITPPAPIVDGITVNISGGCSDLSGVYNAIDVLNGKNSYLLLSEIDLGVDYAISFDGTKWVLHSLDDINITRYENTTVPSGLTPPLTGWVSTAIECDGTLEIQLGINLCEGVAIGDLLNNATNGIGEDLNFYDTAISTTALDPSTLLVSGSYYVTIVNDCEAESDKTEFQVNISGVIDDTVTYDSGVLTANENGATYQWYTCPDELLVNEINQEFTPTAIGDYKVVVTVGFCEVESDCITVGTLSNSNFEKTPEISMYPNPSDNKIQIKSNLNGGYQIINQLGQVVKRFRIAANIESSIYVGDLNQGFYFVKAKNETNTSSKKLIIK